MTDAELYARAMPSQPDRRLGVFQRAVLEVILKTDEAYNWNVAASIGSGHAIVYIYDGRGWFVMSLTPSEAAVRHSSSQRYRSLSKMSYSSPNLQEWLESFIKEKAEPCET